MCNLQSRAPTHAVLVIDLYELLGNPTTELTEPPGPSPLVLYCIIISIFPMLLILFLYAILNMILY